MLTEADDAISFVLSALLACIFKQSAAIESKWAWTSTFSRSLKMFINAVEAIDVSKANTASTVISSIKL